MDLPMHYKFKARLLQYDPRTGFKKGKTFDPKGFYYNGKNVILVGSVKENHSVRMAFPVDSVQISVSLDY